MYFSGDQMVRFAMFLPHGLDVTVPHLMPLTYIRKLGVGTWYVGLFCPLFVTVDCCMIVTFLNHSLQNFIRKKCPSKLPFKNVCLITFFSEEV